MLQKTSKNLAEAIKENVHYIASPKKEHYSYTVFYFSKKYTKTKLCISYYF